MTLRGIGVENQLDTMLWAEVIVIVTAWLVRDSDGVCAEILHIVAQLSEGCCELGQRRFVPDLCPMLLRN